ncbi:MAG TPA: chromosome partition protein MukB [Candidatus Angelobacter sp.]|nr:chromosome partition protein MukB [Candidatus Angelobacter sp.]
MRRTRAVALAIVNWRGVFYERYLLDPNVTALEGANGSGKTTVLIAAFLVLLPDMSRLRFTSLAEHAGGSDRGIWGRLGQPGRPSYAVMELGLPSGERLLAGVHLERRSEPIVEPTTFLITGLADGIALQDILLDRGELDSVPELSQMRSQVARLGGRLHTYTTVKEYFAALFDYGVTPLRLATDEERSKLNEMLRTSMMGGISRALTTDLREFLLKEETGLSDTLKRMRANLEACRRTRTEVAESQKLEHEISAVYEAGQEMFAAAVHATRERAQEILGLVSQARELVRQAERNLDALSQQYEVAEQDLDRITHQLADINRSLEYDRRLLERIEQARVVLKRIRDREANLAQANEVLHNAKSLQETADRRRDSARQKWDAAQLARERAAEGLADFKRGLEELERRAAEHLLVTERFAHAKGFRTNLDTDPETLIQAIEDLEGLRIRANSEFNDLDRILSTIAERRKEHVQILAALQTLQGKHALADRAFEQARSILASLGRLEIQVREAKELPAEIDRIRELAERQQHAREAAGGLETEEMRLSSQQEVERALASCESKLQALELRRVKEERVVDDAQRQLQQNLARVVTLETSLAQWRNIEGKIFGLEDEWNCVIRTRDGVLELRRTILQLRDNERTSLTECEARQVGLYEECRGLEQAGGTFSPQLLRIRDAIGGELLAGRFEEIDPDEAPTVQALLGPLAEAIMVEDPACAFATIAKVSERPDSIWLVGGDAALSVNEQGYPVGEAVDGNVLVRTENSGWRVTRIPDQSALGRRARERRLLELRERQAAAGLEVGQHQSRLRQLEESLNVMDQLLTAADVLDNGDPTSELEITRQAALEDARVVDQHQSLRDEIDSEIQALRPLYRGLRDLLALSWMLDEPDYRARLKELRLQLEAVKLAHVRLDEARPHRIILEEKLDVLRLPPPSDDEVTGLQEHRTSLEKQQARLTEVLQSLRYVNEHRVALEWSDAQVSLREKMNLAPALKDQLEVAKSAASAAEQELKAREAEVQTAIQRVNERLAMVNGLVEAIALDRQEWSKFGIEDASEAELEAISVRIGEAEDRSQTLQQQNKEISKRFNQLELLRSQAKEELQSATTRFAEQERAWKPEQERWQRLQGSAEEHGVLAATLTHRFIEAFSGQGSPNLRQKARERATALKERLARARDVEQVQKAVERLLGPQELSGETYLQAWLEVRNWLRRRIPAQIAQVDEPIEALGRLREHLVALEVRLHQQETELRGESEDIARNIDIHIRRAQRETNRLTLDLEKVRFGSIQGVRLHLQRVERMEQVLNALREGQAQELLFTPDMPIEEALEEILKRFAGGRTGGQKLLDYREYLDPKIAVKRKGAEVWEIVNANRLSTGEGIGIGAAVMMVILAAWERDANLLRPKRSHGTLRLLFLDEANRLDKANLGVLFDLCQSLELQLIVAAPEVARAEGNTTYRLVRRLDGEGREEVIVTGRRTAVAGANA